MGYIGFVFELSEDFVKSTNLMNTNNVSFIKNIILFCENDKFSSNYIIGFLKKLNLEASLCLFISKDLSIDKFVINENFLYKYGKISLSKYTCIDFDYLTFWVDILKYKKLKSLLFIDKESNLDEVHSTLKVSFSLVLDDFV